MALSEPAQVELTKRYQSRLASIRNRVGAAATRAWDGLDSYDEKDVVRYERRIAHAVETARAATVEASTAYYSTLANVDPPAIDPSSVVSSLDSRDPFISTWQALKAGNDYTDAVAAGRSRAEAAAGDFVQSTSRLTGDTVTTASGQRIVGWRRVLTGSSCEWCRTVSTQRYKSSESADFGHNRCDCTAVPIYGDSDPGRILNDTIAPPARAELAEVAPGVFVHPGTPAAFEAAMLADLDNVPDWLRTHLAGEGVEVHIVPNNITDVMPELKGVQPRGWPEGSTWDDVPGIYNDNGRRAVAGNGPNSGAVTIVGHEYGHAVEYAVDRAAFRTGGTPFELLSWRRRGIDLQARLADRLSPYYAQVGNAGYSETFAETFGIFTRAGTEAERVRLIGQRLVSGGVDREARQEIAQEIHDWMDGLWKSGRDWSDFTT